MCVCVCVCVRRGFFSQGGSDLNPPPADLFPLCLFLVIFSVHLPLSLSPPPYMMKHPGFYLFFFNPHTCSLLFLCIFHPSNRCGLRGDAVSLSWRRAEKRKKKYYSLTVKLPPQKGFSFLHFKWDKFTSAGFYGGQKPFVRSWEVINTTLAPVKTGSSSLPFRLRRCTQLPATGAGDEPAFRPITTAYQCSKETNIPLWHVRIMQFWNNCTGYDTAPWITCCFF